MDSITQDELIQMEQEHMLELQQIPMSPENDAEYMAYLESLEDAPMIDGTEELQANNPNDDEILVNWGDFLEPPQLIQLYDDDDFEPLNFGPPGIDPSAQAVNHVEKHKRYFKEQ